jgi:NAD+ diphosphatase
MIQDILPKKLYNQYVDSKPAAKDTVFLFEGSSLLARYQGAEVAYPEYEEFISGVTEKIAGDIHQVYTFTYLFSIDHKKFFLVMNHMEVQKGEFQGELSDGKVHPEYDEILDGYEFIGVNMFRNAAPKDMAFAAITAYHLYGWYRDNRFCGRCGKPMQHDTKERMLRCDACHNMVFPKISPAVIVGIIDKDRILLTKYAGRTYRNYALVAGFTEIGETMEQTVRREVLEEVGLKVKNIRYYKSQPWALSGTILTGFYCELDGDDTIRLQEEELSVGEWFKADEIDFEDDGVSLTREMILKFKEDRDALI